LVCAIKHHLLYKRQTSIVLPKWLTQGGMDCFIKTELNQPNITNTSTHSLRSLGKFYGRISLRSKAVPINLPSMRGVMNKENGLKLRYWAGTAIFGFSAYMLIYGFLNQDWKNFFMGIGLVCLCYPSQRKLALSLFNLKASDEDGYAELLLQIVALVAIVIAVTLF
jgi:hypothetical protein